MEKKNNQGSYDKIIKKAKENQERVTILDVIIDSENYPTEIFPEHLQERITSIRQLHNQNPLESTNQKNNGPVRRKKP